MLCTGRIRWFRYRLLHFLKKNRLNGPVPKWFKFLKSQTQSAAW
jgi:tRNA(Arg) A34 adenosine deaminase TadA